MSRKLLKKVGIIAGTATAGAGLVAVGVPALVAAVGFGSAGITAGSTAAWLMSLAGGATQAGSFVAICQSIGATGAVAGSTVAGGAMGGGIAGYFASGSKDQDPDPEQREEEQNEESEEEEE